MVKRFASRKVIQRNVRRSWSSTELWSQRSVTSTGQENFTLDRAFVLIDTISHPIRPEGPGFAIRCGMACSQQLSEADFQVVRNATEINFVLEVTSQNRTSGPESAPYYPRAHNRLREPLTESTAGVEKSQSRLFPRAWKSRQQRGIPTFPQRRRLRVYE
jgi:hypothetical protein